MSYQRGFSALLIIILLGILVIAGGAGYYFFIYSKKLPEISKNVTTIESVTKPDGFLSYDAPCATFHYPEYYKLANEDVAKTDGITFKKGSTTLSLNGQLNGSDFKLELSCTNDRKEVATKIQEAPDVFKELEDQSPSDSFKLIKFQYLDGVNVVMAATSKRTYGFNSTWLAGDNYQLTLNLTYSDAEINDPSSQVMKDYNLMLSSVQIHNIFNGSTPESSPTSSPEATVSAQPTPSNSPQSGEVIDILKNKPR